MTARSNIPSRLLGVILGVGALAMTALSGVAAAEEAGGACKGLAKDACDKAPNCSWVSGYTNQAGKTVEPFCRNKPAAKEAKPAAAETTPAPKATPAPAAPTTATAPKAPAAPAAASTPAPKAAAPAATAPAPKATPAASGKDSGGKT